MAAGGTFDIDLPLTGTTGVDCRTGGATNDYQLVVSFASPVTFDTPSITSGVGSVAGTTGNGTTTAVVNLTGVTNAQTIKVTLPNVNDGTRINNVVIPMSILIGDTNWNGTVNASDVSQTKSQAGQVITTSNFREDVNGNGVINASDVALVKSKTGTALPAGTQSSVDR